MTERTIKQPYVGGNRELFSGELFSGVLVSGELFSCELFSGIHERAGDVARTEGKKRGTPELA